MFFVINLLNFTLMFVETMISFRLILKLFGAGDTNALISWLYRFTDFLVKPFVGIFEDFHVNGFTLEISSFIAIVAYAFGGFVIMQILRALVGERD